MTNTKAARDLRRAAAALTEAAQAMEADGTPAPKRKPRALPAVTEPVDPLAEAKAIKLLTDAKIRVA